MILITWKQNGSYIDIKLDSRQNICDVLDLLVKKGLLNSYSNGYVKLSSSGQIVSIYQSFIDANIYTGEIINVEESINE